MDANIDNITTDDQDAQFTQIHLVLSVTTGTPGAYHARRAQCERRDVSTTCEEIAGNLRSNYW